MKRKVQKFPLLYSLAEEVLRDELVDKNDEKNMGSKSTNNKFAQEFLGYIKSIELGYGNSKAMAVNENIHSLYTSEKEKSSKEESMRHMLQALSFNLSVDQATDIFPKTMSAEVPNPNDPNIKRTGKQLYEQMLSMLHDTS